MENLNKNVRRLTVGRLLTDEELSDVFARWVEKGKYASPVLRFIEDHLDPKFVPGLPFKVVIVYAQTKYSLGILYKDRVISRRDHVKNGKERALWEWLGDMKHLFTPHIPDSTKTPIKFHQHLQHYVTLSHLPHVDFARGSNIDPKRFRGMTKGEIIPTFEELERIEKHLRRNNVIVTMAYRYSSERACTVKHLDGYPDDLRENIELLIDLRSMADRSAYRQLSKIIKDKHRINKVKV